MARGKYAVKAERRMSQEAIDTIDRLTERLAEEKRRRLDAEARASRFSAAENNARILEAQNDETLAKVVEKLMYWAETAKEDRIRREAAIRELVAHFWVDMKLNHLTYVEKMEFIERRYPRLVDLLNARAVPSKGSVIRDPRSPHRPFEAKLSDADLIRFQHVSGQRHSLTSDGAGAAMAIDYAALFEAEQVGFNFADALELAVDDRALDSSLGVGPGPTP